MSNQKDLALLQHRLGHAETDLASARQEVADADDRAAHYYQLLVAAEAEVEALTARVAELPALLTVAEAAATAQGMLAVHPPSFGAHLTAEGLLRFALALLGDKP